MPGRCLLGALLFLYAQASYAQNLLEPSLSDGTGQPQESTFYIDDQIEITVDSASPLPSLIERFSKHSIGEDLSIDSIWICAQPYYNTWSSDKINPYNLDGVKFADTFMVNIIDSVQLSHWSFPIANTRITSPFGFRRYRWHYGTDLKLYHGDTVSAVFDGIVRIVDYERYGYGHYVVVRHLNGLETLYGHLSKTKVKIGEEVRAGQLLGLGGSTGRSTGTHLHFEVRYQGNAVDPSTIYDFTSDCLHEETYAITPASFSYLVEARKKRFHRIRRGDTLSHIAVRYGTTVSRLCRLNGINRSTILRVGRRIRIS